MAGDYVVVKTDQKIQAHWDEIRFEIALKMFARYRYSE